MPGQVWDTNALLPACEFALPERVHAVAMSRCATAHCLVLTPHVLTRGVCCSHGVCMMRSFT